jgi:cytidylate kinase
MAKDAVLIDNTDLSIVEQNSKIDKLIQSKI